MSVPRRTPTQRFAFIQPLAVFTAIGATTLAFNLLPYAWASWPPSTCMPNCFCEAARNAFIRQPANTYSNLAYILIGLLIAGTAPTQAFQPAIPNPMRDGWRARLYGLTVIAIGLGSIFYHSSLTSMGQWFDWIGMYSFTTFVLMYNLARLRPMPDRLFIATYGLLNVALGVFLVVGIHRRIQVFLGLVALALIVEMFVWLIRRPRLNYLYFAGAMVSLLAAYFVWGLDITRQVCAPESWLQGHAVWHLLTALTVALLYRYATGPWQCG